MDRLADDFVLCRTDYLISNVFPIMDQLRRAGGLCDVTLKVGDKSFGAHRIVLAAAIPYFHGMFTNNMAECGQQDIAIQGIDAIALESLIQFAYSGNIKLNIQYAQSLMVGADFMQLTIVRDACADFLAARLTPSNVLHIRLLGNSMDLTLLVEVANNYVDEYFHDVAMSEEYLSLSVSDLLDIVCRDKLRVTSEEQVFEAVMRWVKEDSSRHKDLPQLLAQVGMPLLSPQYLADRVSMEELVRSSDQCRDLIDEARNYQLMPEHRPSLRRFRTHPRCYNMGHIYAVFGAVDPEPGECYVEVFDHSVGEWQLGVPTSMPVYGAAVAVMQNKLYRCGGDYDLETTSTVEVFDPIQRIWSQVAPMLTERAECSAAALNGKLYVFSGEDGTAIATAEFYDLNKAEWRFLPQMIEGRSAASVVAFIGQIFVLGGFGEEYRILNSVERFDPASGTWTSVVPMLTRRQNHGAAVLDGKLYVCGGRESQRNHIALKTVEVFDPKCNTWQFVSPMNTPRYSVGVVANQGKLWAIGGYANGSLETHKTVEVYDPSTDSWTFSAPLCKNSGSVSVGLIPIG